MCDRKWLATICSLLLVPLASSAEDISDISNCDAVLKNTVLEPLIGESYSFLDTEAKDYSYQVSICKDLRASLKDPKDHHPGAVQVEVGQETERTWSLGSVNHTDLMTGTNWAKLEYRGGHNYHLQHCNGQGRRTVLLVICDTSHSDGDLRLIEENKNKTAECYYLFELSHNIVCAELQPTSLGPGSIVTILFFTFLGLYLTIGFLYQRFVNRAIGKEQIPHYAFWKDVGNLSADGCNFVFRSDGSGGSGSREYRGIGDSQLRNSPDDPPSDTDEHLLPM